MRKISSQTPLQQRISLGYPQDLLARTSTKSGIFEDVDRIPTTSPSKNLIHQDCPTAPNCRRAQRAQRAQPAQPSRRPWPTIMVARIRSNFCQLRCFGKDWNGRESSGKAMEKLRKDVDEIVFVDLYLLGSDMELLRSQRSEGTSVSIGCFGSDWIEGSQKKRHCLRNFWRTSVSIGCRRNCSHH